MSASSGVAMSDFVPASCLEFGEVLTLPGVVECVSVDPDAFQVHYGYPDGAIVARSRTSAQGCEHEVLSVEGAQRFADRMRIAGG